MLLSVIFRCVTDAQSTVPIAGVLRGPEPVGPVEKLCNLTEGEVRPDTTGLTMRDAHTVHIARERIIGQSLHVNFSVPQNLRWDLCIHADDKLSSRLLWTPSE